jgi:hypothetical protein
MNYQRGISDVSTTPQFWNNKKMNYVVLIGGITKILHVKLKKLKRYYYKETMPITTVNRLQVWKLL